MITGKIRDMRTIILIIVILTDCVDSQYPDCVDCPDGSIPLSPLSYNLFRPNVFNGTQPSNEGCTNGVIVSGRATIDCGQGTTLIDCDRGFNDSVDLSNYFMWSRNEAAVAQQVSIVFRFYQQIKISKISMIFWNSQSNDISVPNVRMYWGDYFDGSIILTTEITAIITNSPNRTGEGQRRLNIGINNNGLQFQYLRVEMNFNSEWIFLSEVQLCGNKAPYHITQPSTDNDVQVTSPTATMTSITCSVNITIPLRTIVIWSHEGSIATTASNRNIIRTSHSTTLQIENPGSSDAGVYQCVFNGIANDGWILKRNVRLFITAPSIIHPLNDPQVITFTNSSSSVQLTCSLNITIPSSMTVTWSHNGTITPLNETLTAGNTTTLVIRNPQPSDAGVYQCVFNYRGWMLRRNISVASGSTTTTMSLSSTVTTIIVATTSIITTATVTTTSTAIPNTTVITSIISTATTSTTAATTNTSVVSDIATFSSVTTIATTTAVATTTTTTTTTAVAAVATTTAVAAATTTTTTIVSVKSMTAYNSAITTTTVKFTSIPVTLPHITSDSSSDSNIPIGAIVAVIIVVILLVAIIVTILVLIFIWRKSKKSYDGKSSKQPPLSITGLSISEKDEAFAKDYQESSQANLELQNRSTLDSDYKSEGFPEVLVQSQGQTLSVINPGYQRTKKSDPSAVSEFPKVDVANPRYSIESSRSSVFTDSIDTTAFLSGKIRDSKCDDNPAPCTSIYAEPMPLVKSKGPPVVSIDNIQEIRELGTGVFGKVILANTVGLSYQYLGIGNSNDSGISIKVAVKLLNKSPASAEVKRAFDKEIKFMSRLKDDNVIRLLGICTTGTPFIMMEYMENGDLNNYLQKFKLTTDTNKVPAADEITLIALVHISYQIASGMKYLSSCKFIHRDLASRNVLVGSNYTIKIADFGMSQNLYSAYYCRVGGRSVLPIRWMAYECYFGKFSVKTDVWAFGITLWEIFTLCRYLPFGELSNQQMVEDAIKGAKRKIPTQPEYCPDEIYCIMKSCLQHDPSERAEFKVLCDHLYNYYTNIL